VLPDGITVLFYKQSTYTLEELGMVHETLTNFVLHFEDLTHVHLTSSFDLLKHYGERKRAHFSHHFASGIAEFRSGRFKTGYACLGAICLEDVPDLINVCYLSF
jgi:hypothetical protein